MLPNTLLKSRAGNTKGHWESKKIVEANEAFLAKQGRTWDDWRQINFDEKQSTKFVEQIKDIINEEYAGKSFIVLKDPRFCRYPHLVAKALATLGFTAKFVIISRSPIEVSQSLVIRNGFSEAQSNLLWLRYVLDAEHFTRDFNRTFLTFNQVLGDWNACLTTISNKMNIIWPNSAQTIKKQADQFLDLSLKHHNKSELSTDVYDLKGSWFDTTFHALKKVSKTQDSATVHEELDNIRSQLNDATPSILPIMEIEQKTYRTSKALDQKIKHVQTTLKQNLDSIGGLTKERKTLTSNIAQRDQDIKTLKKEQKKLVSDLERRKNDIETLYQERKSFAADIENRNTDIKVLKSEQKKLVSNIERRDKDIKGLKKEQKKLVSNIERRDKDIKGLKKEQKKLVSNIETLQQEREAFAVDVERRNKDIKGLKKEQKKLVSNIGALNHERKVFAADIQHRDRDIEALKEEQKELVSNIEKRNKDFGLIKEKVVDLEKALEREETLSSYKTNQINEILNSRSWKLLSLPRKAARFWQNKTFHLVKFIGAKNAISHEAGSNKSSSGDNQSSSKATLLARRSLAESRAEVLNSKWHTALLGVKDKSLKAELPYITISAVTFNSEKWLWNFFMSIVELDYPKNKITIHFVDNGSTDQGVKGIESFIATNQHQYRGMKLFRRPNKGYGVGNDYGIRQSNDEFILVTNVDTEFYPDSLHKVVTVAINDTSDVACWELRQTPYEHPKYYDPITLLTNWTSHACVLIRKKAYTKIGGYDPKIFMYGEDVELSYRFRAHGWKLRYVPSAVIKHHVDLEDTTLRPNQLSGSVSANILLRYRFGSYYDILAGEALFSRIRSNEQDPTRMRAWDEVNKIVKNNRWHFFKKRKYRTKAHFPFHEFDYDVVRPGAAVKVTPFKDQSAKNLPKVSVITRTHGQAQKHLENAILSVLNQTYKNIEHIIVEDRTDFGKDIVDSVAAKYGNRISYVKSDGVGRSHCGNYGASQATGDYLCWLDNDDVFYADHIETLVRGLNKTDNAVCSYSLAWDALSDTNNGRIEETKFLLPALHNQPYDKQRLLTENFIPIQAIIFKKSLFDLYGGFEESFSQLEDWNLWTRYAQVGPFAYTPKVTSFYRTPLNSKMRQERHQMLNNAYETVQKANFQDIAKLDKILKDKNAKPKITPRMKS